MNIRMGKSKMKSRDIGLDHGPGKGSASRITDTKAFISNFDEIDWGRRPTRETKALKQDIQNWSAEKNERPT